MRLFLLSEDLSYGYDAVAEQYISLRAPHGHVLLRHWMTLLPQGCSVLDVGAGFGEPLARMLVEAGFQVSAIDASPKMVADFKARLPGVEIACETAEDSAFFGKSFDAAMAVGLIFLLPPSTQRDVIARICGVLKPGGQFLFSSPWQASEWNDVLTGQPSQSLGRDAYIAILEGCGMTLVKEHADKGGSHYFRAQKN